MQTSHRKGKPISIVSRTLRIVTQFPTTAWGEKQRYGGDGEEMEYNKKEESHPSYTRGQRMRIQPHQHPRKEASTPTKTNTWTNM